MPDHKAIPPTPDRRTQERVDTYVSLAALTLEQRTKDVMALIMSFPHEEQWQIMLTGLSVTNSFVARCADKEGIEPAQVPDWMRSLKYDNQIGETE